ncbi:MAG: hypothetical protein GAK35_04109 [Herbaspirillum frisingense]|uniref:Phosphoadenosine phosphosulfate reductase family protein n=1 Tax=Herbaspirillum frisingense TaxID=92645 RepID=A0A7V8FT17_9BURK|nr:MAG: hypothetical protein GAK35_04109 [Herbaspirillum frisingense]
MHLNLSADLLDPRKIASLRTRLRGRPIVLCYGAGVDSTAMMVALRAAGLRPDLVTFADTGGEKPETLAHIPKMDKVLASWGWASITVVRKKTLPSTPYNDLYGNCIANETLPSLAFGMKSCSLKYKADPQRALLLGVSKGIYKAPPHPLWLEAKKRGERIVKLIGYDCGAADKRRSAKLPPADADFDYYYPLQDIGWTRGQCVRAITEALGAEMVPVKSACFFCPASKEWELYWLAAHHPNLLENALSMEYNALTGRHSRFDSIKFGATWIDLVRNHDRFPSSATSVGLGRSFAWCQWAIVNQVANEDFKVLTGQGDRERFLARSLALQREDNAQDQRGIPTSTPRGRVIKIRAVEGV